MSTQSTQSDPSDEWIHPRLAAVEQLDEGSANIIYVCKTSHRPIVGQDGKCLGLQDTLGETYLAEMRTLNSEGWRQTIVEPIAVAARAFLGQGGVYKQWQAESEARFRQISYTCHHNERYAATLEKTYGDVPRVTALRTWNSEMKRHCGQVERTAHTEDLSRAQTMETFLDSMAMHGATLDGVYRTKTSRHLFVPREEKEPRLRLHTTFGPVISGPSSITSTPTAMRRSTTTDKEPEEDSQEEESS